MRVLLSDSVGKSMESADSARQVISASGCWMLSPARLARRSLHWLVQHCRHPVAVPVKGKHAAHPRGSATTSPTPQRRVVSPAAMAGVCMVSCLHPPAVHPSS
jgi:hypothetical protein